MSEHRVRRAAADEADAASATLAQAFMMDPISQWIFPDYHHRDSLHPAFFRVFVDLALADGEVFTTDGLTGVMVWFDIDLTGDLDDGGALRDRMNQSIGPEHAKRFAILDELMKVSHPTHASHRYLAFIGVAPPWQSHGVGTALIGHCLAELDVAGLPAYLEASSTRSIPLYTRLGFEPLGPSIDLPDGPSLFPMWRSPAS